MRHKIAIGLLAYYLLFSFGLVVNAHYCEGDLMSLMVMFEGDTCCGDTDENECCEDDSSIFTFDDNQQRVSHDYSFALQAIELTEQRQLYTPDLVEQSQEEWVFQRPPPLPNEPAYVAHCQLIYYA